MPIVIQVFTILLLFDVSFLLLFHCIPAINNRIFLEYFEATRKIAENIKRSPLVSLVMKFVASLLSFEM